MEKGPLQLSGRVPIQRTGVETHGKSQTHVSLVTVIVVVERARSPTPLQDELCNLGSRPEKQMAPPVTKTTVKTTKDEDAAHQRSEQVTVPAGCIPQKRKAVMGAL